VDDGEVGDDVETAVVGEERKVVLEADGGNPEVVDS
jgi:hypothetical protein